jgi:hypothetical protein
VAIVTTSGGQKEQVRYSAYGVPFGLPAGDVDSDGDCNSGDTSDSDQIQTWITGMAYDVRGDADLDGDVDATDKAAVISVGGVALGHADASTAAVDNRRGSSGSLLDNRGYSAYMCRTRSLHASLGIWQTRDLLSVQYADTMNTYAVNRLAPVTHSDPFGLLVPPGCLFAPMVAAAAAPQRASMPLPPLLPPPPSNHGVPTSGPPPQFGDPGTCYFEVISGGTGLLHCVDENGEIRTSYGFGFSFGK